LLALWTSGIPEAKERRTREEEKSNFPAKDEEEKNGRHRRGGKEIRKGGERRNKERKRLVAPGAIPLASKIKNRGQEKVSSKCFVFICVKHLRGPRKVPEGPVYIGSSIQQHTLQSVLYLRG
jgi:hypothetical protein